MESAAVDELALRARAGDQAALGSLLETHRVHLLRMIELRLDPRMRRRIDAADVLQEAYLDAARRIRQWDPETGPPFRIWLRLLAREKTVDAHRRHLAAGGRDVRREEAAPATSVDVAARHIASQTSPSSAAARKEEHAGVERALAALHPLDREILVMRHVEHLRNVEAARELGLDVKAASKRYLRALQRLKEAMAALGSQGPRDGA